MAKFAIYNGETFEREVDVTEHGAFIGRSEQNDIVLPDPSKAVSRQHAELRYEDGSFAIVDLNSQNGVWLGDERVEHAALQPGDEVIIGGFRLVWIPEAEVADLPPEEAGPDYGASVPVPPPPQPVAHVPPASQGPGVLMVVAVAALVVLAGAAYVVFFTDVGRTPAAPSTAEGVTQAPNSTTPPIAAEPTPPTVQTLPPPVPSERPVETARRTEGVVPSQVTDAPRPTPRESKRRPEVKAATEPDAAEAARSRALQERIDRAKAALAKGDYGAAIGGLEGVLAEQPKHAEATALLQTARTRVQEEAKRAYEAGLQAEAAGNQLAALERFEQAARFDPDFTAAREGGRRVRERMKVAGEDAYKRAKQYDAVGRTADAIAMYEKALQMLAPDNPMRANAKERLDALKGIK